MQAQLHMQQTPVVQLQSQKLKEKTSLQMTMTKVENLLFTDTKNIHPVVNFVNFSFRCLFVFCVLSYWNKIFFIIF